MTRRTAALAAALSLLPLGQPLVLGSTSALATGAVLLSIQKADAQSAQVFIKHGYGKIQLGEYQGAIAQSLLPLRQGMPYPEAHQKMINVGWQMVYTYIGCTGVPPNAETACAKYANVIDCSANGWCSWRWVNDSGKRLIITSFGMGADGNVTNWKWE